MSAQTDGLDSLDALAERAKRRASPPRRRVLAPQHPAAPTVPARKSEPPSSVQEVPAGQELLPGFDQDHDVPTVNLPAQSAVTARVELRKVAVYLDETTDAALDAIHFAAASARPRQDVSKSAVVRLALNRLLSELSHDEVVAFIAAQSSDQHGVGRKRR